MEVEEAWGVGSVHVGHQMWERLDLDGISSRAGLSDLARTVGHTTILSLRIEVEVFFLFCHNVAFSCSDALRMELSAT